MLFRSLLSAGDLKSSRSTLEPVSGVPEVDSSGAADGEVEISGELTPPSALSNLSFSFLSFLSFLLDFSFSFSAFSEEPLTFGPELRLSFPVTAAGGGGVGAADLFARYGMGLSDPGVELFVGGWMGAITLLLGAVGRPDDVELGVWATVADRRYAKLKPEERKKG